MAGLRGKDRKHSAFRDVRSGAYDRGTRGRVCDQQNDIAGDDMPEGLRRKPKGAPNKGFRRGEPAKHVPQND
jgi:hypothetical protein